MNPLVFAALFTAPVVLGAASGSLDIGTMLASYGIAAPFAALCWWQMQRSQNKLDAAEKTIAQLQNDAVASAREFANRFGPLLYDSALLYRQGNQKLTEGLAQPSGVDVHELATQVTELIRRIDER